MCNLRNCTHVKQVFFYSNLRNFYPISNFRYYPWQIENTGKWYFSPSEKTKKTWNDKMKKCRKKYVQVLWLVLFKNVFIHKFQFYWNDKEISKVDLTNDLTKFKTFVKVRKKSGDGDILNNNQYIWSLFVVMADKVRDASNGE